MKDCTTLHDVYFGLGTNLGNKEENIHQAIKNIEERIGCIIAYSAFFITRPVGFESENLFINAACHAKSFLSPFDILALTKKIEIDMGRTSKSIEGVYTDRIIDIDMLMYDNLIIEHTELTLPHPRIVERDFVLMPLTEIASAVVHPILNIKIGDLAGEK